MHRTTLAIDQHPAPKTAAGHLACEFDDTFRAETIERFPDGLTVDDELVPATPAST